VWFVVLPALLFGTLGVLGPLQLSQLGFGAIGIGAVWLVTGGLEAVNNVAVGRAADRYGPLVPIRVALVGTVLTTLLLPWPENPYVLAVLIGLAGIAFGTFYTPGMTLLTHAAEERALDYGYAFALVNLAWAPGQSGGSAVGGAIAQATSDAVPYLALSGVALLTLAGLWRSRSFS
jgi:predicted MFS family arabinose efflux permease